MSTSDLPLRTLLIVEDDSDLRELIANEVNNMGYTVIEAANGTEGLAAIKEKTIHAVLCDIIMPMMTGLELLATVRGLGLSTPFVFLTGRQTEENLLLAVRLGAYDFLRKPFETADLKATVERVLDVGIRIASTQKTIEKMKLENLAAAEQLSSYERDQMHILRLQALGSKNRT
jgi:sigma-B regulation protein RsbU (phosphoserine phosphatase)